MSDPELPPRLLWTPDIAAHVLNVSRTAVFQLMKEGQLASTKIGKRRLIFPESVDAYLARLRRDSKSSRGRQP